MFKNVRKRILLQIKDYCSDDDKFNELLRQRKINVDIPDFNNKYDQLFYVLTIDKCSNTVAKIVKYIKMREVARDLETILESLIETPNNTNNTLCWNFPKGGLNVDELSISCITRELKEELNIILDDDYVLSDTIQMNDITYIGTDSSEYKCNFYFGELLHTNNVKVDNMEMRGFDFFTVEEIKNLTSYSEVFYDSLANYLN